MYVDINSKTRNENDDAKIRMKCIFCCIYSNDMKVVRLTFFVYTLSSLLRLLYSIRIYRPTRRCECYSHAIRYSSTYNFFCSYSTTKGQSHITSNKEHYVYIYIPYTCVGWMLFFTFIMTLSRFLSLPAWWDIALSVLFYSIFFVQWNLLTYPNIF